LGSSTNDLLRNPNKDTNAVDRFAVCGYSTPRVVDRGYSFPLPCAFRYLGVCLRELELQVRAEPLCAAVPDIRLGAGNGTAQLIQSWASVPIYVLWAAGAPSKPPARRPGQPTIAKGPPGVNVNIDLAGPTGRIAGSTTPPCNVAEERAKLDAAEYARNDGYREQAADQYLALTESCDPRTSVAASEQFHITHEQMSSWWWQMGCYFPPFRWYNVHFPRFWIVLAIAGAIIFAIVYVPKLRMVRSTARWIAKPPPRVTELFFATQFPRASIMTPGKLTPDTQADLFAAMLQSSAEEVRRVLDRAGGGLQVRSTALLSLPTCPVSPTPTAGRWGSGSIESGPLGHLLPRSS